MLILLVSPGIFHASVAYLPSSFAMYTVTLALAQFMDWRGGMRTPSGIFWIGLGSCLGWPFAAVMVLPFVAEELMLATFSKDNSLEVAYRLLYGTTRTLIAAGVQFFIDVFFYRKVAFVPFNIIWYNVVAASEGKGPNIYGTEPWHFYIRNLLINFNVWFILACLAMPLALFHGFVLGRPTTKQNYIRNIVFMTPFYLWLAIFTVQPHKEERFMYPVYPCLALNAAIAVHVLLSILGSSNAGPITFIPAKIRLAFVVVLGLVAANLGILRILGMVTAYGAPLSVYKPLQLPGIARPGDTVCLGKEWYRFPSSYHLPNGVKAKFVRSEFSGLLPGEFSEGRTGFGLFPGAWLMPSGMNDENREDPGKYVSAILPRSLQG